jgi:hypothetical protein
MGADRDGVLAYTRPQTRRGRDTSRTQDTTRCMDSQRRGRRYLAGGRRMSRPKPWKDKGRRESGRFAQVPHDVINSLNWRRASGNAVKLVLDLMVQFNGKNNGDLSAPFSAMKARGWKSSGTLKRAEREALHYGLIEKTRQGGLNRCNLYAITWRAIDDCKRKLDCSPTRVAGGAWRREVPPFENKTPVRKSN